MSEPVLKVEHLSKKFCRTLKRSLWYGCGDIMRELGGRERSPHVRKGEFWALKDVDLELGRGDIVGIVGRNGAGKTTLLRIINGLIKPDAGRVSIRGRVGAMIALGVGFNPVLTGRENIYVAAAVLGIQKRQVNEMLDEILAFAEIGDAGDGDFLKL